MKRAWIVVAGALLALASAAPAWAQDGSEGNVGAMAGCSGEGCWPTYSHRDFDTDVIALQYFLRHRGYASFQPNNGYFGPETVRAVRRFQQAKGIPANGVVGARTWEALIAPVRPGQRNDAVRALQVELRDQYRYGLPVTGYYGSQTRAAVADFQRDHGLKATGSADRPTLQAIIGAR